MPYLNQRTQLRAVAFIAFLGFIWFMREASAVVMPAIISALLAIIIGPLAQRMRRRMPGMAAIGLSLLLVVLVMLGFGAVLGWVSYRVAATAPGYVDEVSARLAPLSQWVSNAGLEVNQAQVIDEVTAFVRSGVNSLTSFLTGLVIVLFLTGFLIGEMCQFQEKAQRAFHHDAGERSRAIVADMVGPMRRYVLVKLIISLASGAVAALVCWALGVGLWPLWGVLTFALNWIPNIGSVISTLLPSAFALATSGSGEALLVLAVLGAWEITIGNLIEPKVMGNRLSLSPYVVLLSLVFWGWLWGLVGIFIAVPLTLALKILCCHSPTLRPVGIFIAGDVGDDEHLSATTHVIPDAKARARERASAASGEALRPGSAG